MSEPPDEAAGAHAPDLRDAVHDDDELANALAAQLLRFAPTGAIPVVRPSAAEPTNDPAAEAASSLAPTRPRFSTSEPAAAQAESRPVAQTVPEAPERPVTPAPEPVRAPEPEPALPVAAPAVAEPAPAAATAIPIPLPEGATALDRAEQLQAVLDRVNIDDATYAEWERSLLGIGGPSRRPESVPMAADPEPDPDFDPEPDATAGEAGQAVSVAAPLSVSPPISVPMRQEEPQPTPPPSHHGGFAPLGSAHAQEPDQELPPITSSIDLPTLAETEVPADELVVTALLVDDDAEVVEAELLDPETSAFQTDDDQTQDGETSDPGAADSPAAEYPYDVDDDDDDFDGEADAELAEEPVEASFEEPTPEPVRGYGRVDDDLAGFAPMFRPSVPGAVAAAAFPLADSDDPQGTDAELSEPEAEEPQPIEPEPIEPEPLEPESLHPVDFVAVVPAVPLDDSVPVTTGSIPISVDPAKGASDELSVTTGSIPIFTPVRFDLDADVDEGVDDVATPLEAKPISAAIPLPVAPAEPGQDTGPITPISTASLVPPTVSPLPVAEEPDPAPFIEEVGLEPTPLDRRIGELGRMFWLWVAPNTSVLTFALGAVVIGAGLSARQSILAAVIGILLACLPLAMMTLAVKRSGQPTAIVSRASFGVVGNIVPAVLLLVVRLFWIAVLLWVLSAAIASLTFQSGYDLFVAPQVAGLVALALVGLGAAAVAVIGQRVIIVLQAVLAALGAVVAVVVIVLTAPLIDLRAITSTPDGDATAVLAGAVTVFALLGTAWAAAGGDLARYQRPGTSGGASAALAGLGAALPSLVLIAWGILLAGSDEALSVGLQTDPIAAIAGALPAWYPIPVLLAIVASILSGVGILAYSGGLTLLAVGVRTHRAIASGAVALVGIVAGVAMALLLPSLSAVLLDLAPTLAVPVAAWGGIVAAEMLMRRRGFDSDSLLHRGGIYPDVRWVNLGALVVITVIGFGLIAGTQGWFTWEGYLWRVFGVDTDQGIGAADLGVLVALALGLLTPVALGIPALRRTEVADSAPR